MDYDEAIAKDNFSWNIKQRFYELYISPYLKHRPNSSNLAFFMDKAFEAWRLCIKNEDLKDVLFVENICNKLFSKYKKDFRILLSAIINAEHDSCLRSETLERNYYNALISKNEERIIRDALELYKGFFENKFKLWITLPYFFICYFNQVKSGAKKVDDYVTVGSTKKYYEISEILSKDPNFSFCLEGFDNKIRNAGGGHESWEINDNGNILLKDINPKTGEEKDNIEISLNDLEKLILKCRKTIWILSMGIYIFMNNNPEFSLKNKNNYKKREVEDFLKNFSKERSLLLKNFSVIEDASHKKEISFKLEYVKSVIGDGGQFFIGESEAYDLIKQTEMVDYKHQVIGIIQFLISFYKIDELAFIKLILKTHKGELLELKYCLKELKKIKKRIISEPSVGKMPIDCYPMYYEIRVPIGERVFYEKKLKDFNLQKIEKNPRNKLCPCGLGKKYKKCCGK